MRFNANARFSLSHTDKYLVVLNLFSNATNCSYVNAVRARRGLPCFEESDNFPFISLPSAVSMSLTSLHAPSMSSPWGSCSQLESRSHSESKSKSPYRRHVCISIMTDIYKVK